MNYFVPSNADMVYFYFYLLHSDAKVTFSHLGNGWVQHHKGRHSYDVGSLCNLYTL